MRQGQVARGANEIKEHFNDQMEFLLRSSANFDNGWENEAKRLSVALRILLHDKGNNSKSLLGQMGHKDTMDFVDSGIRREHILNLIGEEDTPNVMITNSELGLVIPVMTANNENKYIAPLRNSRYPEDMHEKLNIVPFRKFNEWWTDSFIESTSNHTYSRYDLVMTMADQDGGAHVDPAIDAKFNSLKHDFFNIAAGYSESSMRQMQPNIIYASIRQIAHEVMASVDIILKTKYVERSLAACRRPSYHTIIMATSIKGITNPK